MLGASCSPCCGDGGPCEPPASELEDAFQQMVNEGESFLVQPTLSVGQPAYLTSTPGPMSLFSQDENFVIFRRLYALGFYYVEETLRKPVFAGGFGWSMKWVFLSQAPANPDLLQDAADAFVAINYGATNLGSLRIIATRGAADTILSFRVGGVEVLDFGFVSTFRLCAFDPQSFEYPITIKAVIRNVWTNLISPLESPVVEVGFSASPPLLMQKS